MITDAEWSGYTIAAVFFGIGAGLAYFGDWTGAVQSILVGCGGLTLVWS